MDVSFIRKIYELKLYIINVSRVHVPAGFHWANELQWTKRGGPFSEFWHKEIMTKWQKNLSN